MSHQAETEGSMGRTVHSGPYTTQTAVGQVVFFEVRGTYTSTLSTSDDRISDPLPP